jgi:hypothetical protein
MDLLWLDTQRDLQHETKTSFEKQNKTKQKLKHELHEFRYRPLPINLTETLFTHHIY